MKERNTATVQLPVTILGFVFTCFFFFLRLYGPECPDIGHQITLNQSGPRASHFSWKVWWTSLPPVAGQGQRMFHEQLRYCDPKTSWTIATLPCTICTIDFPVTHFHSHVGWSSILIVSMFQWLWPTAILAYEVLFDMDWYGQLCWLGNILNLAPPCSEVSCAQHLGRDQEEVIEERRTTCDPCGEPGWTKCHTEAQMD